MRVLGLGVLLIAGCAIRGSNMDLATGDATDPVVVSRDCRGAPEDPVHLAAMVVDGDQLRVTVQHGGGCGEHTFAACWNGLIQETAPPRTSLVIHHDADGDACDAFLTHDIVVDVSALGFEIGSAAVLDPAGTIELVGR
jgi:hypothetical protein